MAKFETERYRHNTQLQSSFISGVTNAPTVSHTFTAETAVAEGDVLLIAKLPPRSAILHVEMLCSALGGSIAADVGIMDADEDNIVAKFLDGASLAAQKWYKVSDNAIEGRLSKVNDDAVTLAVKFNAAGTIPKDAVIHVTPHYRHATNGE